MKIQPKRIVQVLEEKSLPVPKRQKLSNYLILSREKFYGTSTISLGELETWYQQSSLAPDDDDKL